MVHNNSWLETNYPGAGKQLGDEIWAKPSSWLGRNQLD